MPQFLHLGDRDTTLLAFRFGIERHRLGGVYSGLIWRRHGGTYPFSQGPQDPQWMEEAAQGPISALLPIV